MIVTKTLEWDMGHRIPNHQSKCRNPHGHRYKMEVSLQGKIIDKQGDSSESMILDFKDIKAIAETHIIEPCDHAFMYWNQDTQMLKFFKDNPSFKSLCVSFIPTAEEIARWIFERLEAEYKDEYNTDLSLVSVKLWETPTSSAYISRKHFIL